MDRRIERPGVRGGYDLWADGYDDSPNPVVAMDRRVALIALDPHPGETVLDLGCGTGAHLERVLAAGADALGIDFSAGMMAVARRRCPGARLVLADLRRDLPLAPARFDKVLCSLVSEHLDDLPRVFREIRRVLRPGGRLVFSAFHPHLAESGVEANFAIGDVEYRLGAERHSVRDYLSFALRAELVIDRCTELRGDDELTGRYARAAKYDGRPMLLLLEARRAA